MPVCSLPQLACSRIGAVFSVAAPSPQPLKSHSHCLPPRLKTQLACARIGAVFSVVFAGFSAESLAGRLTSPVPK